MEHVGSRVGGGRRGRGGGDSPQPLLSPSLSLAITHLSDEYTDIQISLSIASLWEYSLDVCSHIHVGQCSRLSVVKLSQYQSSILKLTGRIVDFFLLEQCSTSPTTTLVFAYDQGLIN